MQTLNSSCYICHVVWVNALACPITSGQASTSTSNGIHQSSAAATRSGNVRLYATVSDDCAPGTISVTGQAWNTAHSGFTYCGGSHLPELCAVFGSLQPTARCICYMIRHTSRYIASMFAGLTADTHTITVTAVIIQTFLWYSDSEQYTTEYLAYTTEWRQDT